MKKVSMYDLKQQLASVIGEAEAGIEILVTRHNKPVARLTGAGEQHLHQGSRYGKADLKPVLHRKTGGHYLRLLREDRQSGRE